MRTLNLGILAHVDAGKTSLTERLLFAAGVIDEIGRVDDGTTLTDSLAMERERGITIKTAVASFVVSRHDVTVSLIDTPGHPDFIAEVERVLRVLDGVVLVVSAVEGVQSQTRVLMRTLQRLQLPTIIFVNKIDRAGADPERVRREIEDKLTPHAVAMGSVHSVGDRGATFAASSFADRSFGAQLLPVLAEHDDTLLAAFVADTVPSGDRLRAALACQTRDAAVHPVYFGSAMTGAGVDPLVDGCIQLLPTVAAETGGPAAGTVFKVERGPTGERVAFVRLFTGTVRVRDRLVVGGVERKVTALEVFEQGAATPRATAHAGQIAKLRGLEGVNIGDTFGPLTGRDEQHFAPPTLETVVVPRNTGSGALFNALSQLAEQDPLIDLRQDDGRRELYVSLYGEVQKEVLHDTLLNDYGIEVTFETTTTICIERVSGSGRAVEPLSGRRRPNHPFLAGVGLRIEPAPVDSGVAFELEIERGSLPAAFLTAIEESARASLAQGLYGWNVPDCRLTLTHSGYCPRQSHMHATFDKSMSSVAADFRYLTPLVLFRALSRAGTTVCEPIHRFQLEVPPDALGSVQQLLSQLRAVTSTASMTNSSCTVEGEIPAARGHELQQRLPPLTSGEAVLELAFSHHQPVSGPYPTRARTDDDPLDRAAYLTRVRERT